MPYAHAGARRLHRSVANHRSFFIACAVLSTLVDFLLDEGNSKIYLLVFFR